MANEEESSTDLCCLDCSKPFTAADLAAMTVSEEHDLCIVDCASCGVHNVVRALPQPGLDAQPTLVALRTVAGDIDVASVFEETVRSGVYVHPVTAGSSN